MAAPDDSVTWCPDDDVIIAVTSRGCGPSSTLFSAGSSGPLGGDVVTAARRFFLGGVSGDDEDVVTL